MSLARSSVPVLCLSLILVIPWDRDSGAVADLVIRQGQLIAMVADDPEVVPLKGLVVNGGRIERVIRADDPALLPSAREVVEAQGRYILPGLIDAHVHFQPWFPEIVLRYGVTTLMDTGPCGSDCDEDPNEWILRFKRALDGSTTGPTLYITGMKLAGPEAKPENQTYRLQSLDELVTKVDLLARLGVDGLKAEQQLPVEFRRRLVEEARRRGLPVVGHSREVRESVAAGMRFIEHMYPIAFSLSGDPAALQRGNEHLMDLDKAPALIRELVAQHVYVNPTLLGGFVPVSGRRQHYLDQDTRLLQQPLFAAIPAARRQQILASYSTADTQPGGSRERLRESYAKVKTFLRQLHLAGGRIIAGSDVGAHRMPGLATHREMELLVEAGLPPYAALLGATRYPAEMIRKGHLIGTVQEGKQADLLILRANPLEHISATQEPDQVIRRGKVVRGGS